MTQTTDSPVVENASNDASTSTNDAASIAGEKGNVGKFVSRNLQSLALVPVILVVGIFGTVTSPYFLTTNNLLNNVLALSAALGVLVIAESIILIGGYFDLSMQSTVGFSVMLLAVLLSSGDSALALGLSTWQAILVTLAVVVVIGLFNGFMVSVLNLNAFIVTLAMLILVEGFTLGISNGETFTNLPAFITSLGTATVLGVPIHAIVFVVSFAVAAAFMKLTPTGRSIYAMGGSSEAARAAGIRTGRLTIGLFVFGSVMALVAGWLLVSKTAAATASLGDGIIFTVFAAAVLGGIDLNGGRGTLIGAALGVLLLGVIQNILTLSNVPSFWINAAYGAIILSALLVGRFSVLTSKIRKRA